MTSDNNQIRKYAYKLMSDASWDAPVVYDVLASLGRHVMPEQAPLLERIRNVVYDVDGDDDGSPLHAVMVDIDGTVALRGARSPFDETKVGEDEPNHPVITLVQTMHHSGYSIVFTSGRTEECRRDTETWLRKHVVEDFALFMRASGDVRKDSIIKTEIYERDVRPRYNVLCVLDDRNQVVQAWRASGLTCLQVADGDF